MFYYLNGTITILDTNLAVVDCGGVGYACHTTNYTLSKLQVGKQAKLFTYCNIKEDAFDIYGFSTREELNCFERLLGVGGVGPKAALAILSVVTPDQFLLAVMTQDEKTLTMAQGVGKKMAQRILLELKDKLAPAQMELSGAQMESAVRIPYSEVPHMRVSTVKGHDGAFLFGAVRGRPVMVMTGTSVFFSAWPKLMARLDRPRARANLM